MMAPGGPATGAAGSIPTWSFSRHLISESLTSTLEGQTFASSHSFRPICSQSNWDEDLLTPSQCWVEAWDGRSWYGFTTFFKIVQTGKLKSDAEHLPQTTRNYFYFDRICCKKLFFFWSTTQLIEDINKMGSEDRIKVGSQLVMKHGYGWNSSSTISTVPMFHHQFPIQQQHQHH